MKRILTAQEMSRADADAIRMGLPSLVLMERAALSVVEEIDRKGYDTSRVLVAVGSGNNGGDGVAIARLLAERGEQPVLLLTGNSDKRSEQLRTQLQVSAYYGIPEVTEYEPGVYTLVVDALFGIGLGRPVAGRTAELIEKINADSCPKVAVDIPSGVESNTGHLLGTAVKADLTVTFAAGKPGHYLYPGTAYCGQVVVKEIGIPVKETPESSRMYRMEDADFAALPPRDESGNKGTFGKLLVIAGSRGICGAAYLCAAAALKRGIGMVKIFTHEANRTALSVLLPEALIDTYGGNDDPEEPLKNALAWADAAVIGPGLSTQPEAKRLLTCFEKHNTLPAVYDADALNLIAGDGALWKKQAGRRIVTPHIGEMSRLTGMAAGEIQADPVGTALVWAAAHEAVCVLKDARTVTAYPDGRCFINATGCSALATAGSGDVLAGLVGAMLLTGRGTTLPVEAMAVHLHGRLGEAAAGEMGKEAATAGDLIRMLQRTPDELFRMR